MKKLSIIAAAAAALAAPLAFGAAPAVAPMHANLSGIYAGLNLGIASPSTTIEDSDCWYECSAYTLRTDGAGYGIKVGQNLTDGSFLYGWDVDYNLASTEESYDYAYYNNDPAVNPAMKVTSKLKSFGSVRAKAGIVMQDTALSLSYGYAMGKFEDEFRDQNNDPNPTNDQRASSDGSKSGLVYGASIQHSLTSSLLLTASVDKYVFKTDTQFMHDSDGTVNSSYYKLRFVDNLDTFTVSLAYKF